MNNNPSILWAQDRANLFITIEVNNFKNQDITFNTNNVRLVGASGNIEYDIVIDFNSDIVNEKSNWIIKQNCIELVVMKGKQLFWHNVQRKTVHISNKLFKRVFRRPKGSFTYQYLAVRRGFEKHDRI